MRHVDVGDGDVRRRTGAQIAARQAEDFRRPLRQAFGQPRQADMAVVVEPQRRREQRLEPDRAVRGFREGQPLGVDILRVVRRRR